VDVTVPTGSPLELTLRRAPLSVDPITVTVTRGTLSPRHSPLAASALGTEELARSRDISLARTVDRLPGIRNLSTGLEIGKPVIRGLTGPRVLVLSQGMRLEDYSWSDEDGPTVDAALAEKVEVVRGPATVLYGADAVGGVVNVVPRSLPEAAGDERIFRGSVELGARSNNRETDLTLEGEGAGGPWGWRATVTGRRAEALRTPVGELENTGFEALTGEAAVTRRGEWGSVTARYARYGGEFRLLEEGGPPEGEGGEEPEEEGPERKLSDDRLQVVGNFPLGDLRLEARLQGQRHHLVELEDDPEALREGRFVEVEIFDLLLDTGLGEVLLHHSLAPGVEGTVGATGELQNSTGAGVVPLVPDASMASGGVFALERLERGRLTLLGGARVDLEQVDTEGGPTRTFGAVTGSLGATYDLTEGVSLSGNVGSAWRAPSLFELFASGPRLGEARYEIGDPALDEERAINVDVGLRWATDRLRGNVAAFANDFRDFLFIQPTGETRDGYQVYRYEQADALLWGGEASLEAEVVPWLALGVRGEVVRGTNEERDEPLPLIPPASVTLSAEVQGEPAWADRAFATVEGEIVMEPTHLNPLDTPVDGHGLLHFGAGAEGRRAGRDVRVDLSVRNLLDESYRDFLSRYKAFALNPGRDVQLRVRVGL
jgi:outer membrane receptor protein involved in Fe transport